MFRRLEQYRWRSWFVRCGKPGRRRIPSNGHRRRDGKRLYLSVRDLRSLVKHARLRLSRRNYTAEMRSYLRRAAAAAPRTISLPDDTSPGQADNIVVLRPPVGKSVLAALYAKAPPNTHIPIASS